MQISKKEAIEFFEEFSESKLSPTIFLNEGVVYRFKPSSISGKFFAVFYIVCFATPHLIYFFRRFSIDEFWNIFFYILLILVTNVLIFVFARFIAPSEIVINNLVKEVEIIPKDFLAKYIKSKVVVKIADIVEIKDLLIKTKSGSEVHLQLHTIDKQKYRLFVFSTWDNVTKLKAAFTTLVFNKETEYDDSNEPSVIFDKQFKELLNEKESETSYIPFVVLVATVLIVLIGFGLYFVFGKTNSYCAQIDSLTMLIIKVWLIALAIYAIPIYFASHTAYQIKRKATRKIIIVFGLMATLGFYFCSFGLINFLNVKLDSSKALPAQANVVNAYYTSGRKSSYTIVLQIAGLPEKVFVNHHDRNLHTNLKPTIGILIYKGYFNKRWLRIE